MGVRQTHPVKPTCQPLWGPAELCIFVLPIHVLPTALCVVVSSGQVTIGVVLEHTLCSGPYRLPDSRPG